MERAAPLRPEPARHVGQRVLADRVQARHAHPPERVLDEVPRDVGIVLAEVGQDVDEPAVQRLALDVRRGVRIGDGPGLPDVLRVSLRASVEPGRGRGIRHPRVIGAGVVRHLVLDHLQSEAVRRVHQLPVLGEVAEVLVHGVEVHRAVTVVVGDGGAVVALALVEVVHVVVDGRGPDRGDAEVLQVGQAVDDPLQVATVVVARLRAVVEAP